jgi:hypothetical protein
VRLVPEPVDQNGSEPAVALVKTGNGVAVAEVRTRLGELAAANLGELGRVLVETATGADKPTWVTTTCKGCGRSGRHEVLIPDYRVRLDAIEKLLQQGLGRVGEASEAAAPRLPARVEEAERMSWPEMEALAAFLTDEFRADVRGRVAALSAEQRRLLRRELDEAPSE